MKSIVYKYWYALVNTVRTKWLSIVSMFFALVGGAFTLSEILGSVFGNTIGFTLMRSYTIPGSIAFVIICVIYNWTALTYSCFIANCDTRITLSVCDIFSQKGALVIPTNTTFDTTMDDEFISIHSVQGQYQEKFFHNALSRLDNELSQALRDYSYELVQDGRHTNRKKYPIGSVCKISRGSEHDYFLAVVDINKYGKPENVTLDNITCSLFSFWQQINKIGHLESIRIPIIGTGRAGLKNASRDQIIQKIIFSFVATAREMKVTESLTICIHPSDFANKNIHWNEICDYLRCICKFQDNLIEAPISANKNFQY